MTTSGIEYKITHRFNKPVSKIFITDWIPEEQAKKFMLNPRIVFLSFDKRAMKEIRANLVEDVGVE